MNGKFVNKYVNISGLNLTENNRGTAALGYGAFSFLLKKEFLKRGDIVVRFKYFRSFRDYINNRVVTDYILCEGEKITILTVPVFFIEKKITEKMRKSYDFREYQAWLFLLNQSRKDNSIELIDPNFKINDIELVHLEVMLKVLS